MDITFYHKHDVKTEQCWSRNVQCVNDVKVDVSTGVRQYGIFYLSMADKQNGHPRSQIVNDHECLIAEPWEAVKETINQKCSFETISTRRKQYVTLDHYLNHGIVVLLIDFRTDFFFVTRRP